MKEIADIIFAFKKAQQQNKKAALATVVHVEGSSYRRPGARMLVTEDGELTGAISGGCLEGDALKKALLAIAQNQNKLVAYNSMDEDDSVFGVQLGCNGIVYILFEPVDASKENNPVALLEKITAQTKPAVLVTLFSIEKQLSRQAGTCMAFSENNHYSNIGNKQFADAINDDIKWVFENGRSAIKNYSFNNGNYFSAFIELLQPPVELIIAGAGNDVFPLVKMASVLGWHITVADGRKSHANEKRFPSVKKIIVAKPAEVISQTVISEQTVVLLMTHNYNYDLAMLRQLIGTTCSYIGVLGPKKKFEKMLQALQEEGMAINDDMLQKVHAPVGLDIGAETAEEIALSILSGIKAALSKKSGGPLKNKAGFIHEHNAVLL